VANDLYSRPDEATAQRTRAAIVRLLGELRRPARTREIAERLHRHPNGIRIHLERLEAAGFVERLKVAGARGRPRYEWAVAAEPASGCEPPTAYRDLAHWLARITGGSSRTLADVQETGRQIGREAAPADAQQAPPAALRTILAAFGFQPSQADDSAGHTAYTLRNCPYRDVVAENQSLVCALHRGITDGLLERLAPTSELTAFVPKDPHQAGCLITVDWHDMPSPPQLAVEAPTPFPYDAALDVPRCG
jgi:predicted ArsR family transcriptional regulator